MDVKKAFSNREFSRPKDVQTTKMLLVRSNTIPARTPPCEESASPVFRSSGKGLARSQYGTSRSSADGTDVSSFLGTLPIPLGPASASSRSSSKLLVVDQIRPSQWIALLTYIFWDQSDACHLRNCVGKKSSAWSARQVDSVRLSQRPFQERIQQIGLKPMFTLCCFGLDQNLDRCPVRQFLQQCKTYRHSSAVPEQTDSPHPPTSPASPAASRTAPRPRRR